MSRRPASKGKPGSESSESSESDSLGQYRKKRDPTQTTEPFASASVSPGGTRVGRFVVHQHAATRTHFDLRIEVGGALESFAIPKGPTLDPEQKRLAVQVERHPLEYLEFEDVIPEGSYGAGPMIIWDRGQVRYLEGSAEEGIARGKIDFELFGYKLLGRFALVHTGARKSGQPNQWLLVKKGDAHATKEPIADPSSVLSGLRVEELEQRAAIAAGLRERARELGSSGRGLDVGKLSPMLCSSDGASLDDPTRLYELKLDGVRILASRRGDSVMLRYRTGRAAAATFPEVARALRALPADRFVLDGEMVAFDERGRPRFQRLGPRLGTVRARDRARAAAEVPVVYLAFDLLELEGFSLLEAPLRERKALLGSLVRGRGQVRVLDHLEGHGRTLYDFCRKERLEGVVSKRADGPYRPGPVRTRDWMKIKCERDDEFIVAGWEEGRGDRKKLGALRLATWSGEALVLRGRAGSGLDAVTISLLLERLAPLETDDCPAQGELGKGRGPVHHARPDLVVSVRFLGWSDEGVLREPVFRAVRDDVSPSACVAAPPGGDRLDPEALPEPEPAASSRVVLSHREKIFWPDEGYTKGDLLDYYAHVSPALLPFLKDRPVIVVRYPDGIAGKSFFQWRAPEGTPGFIHTLELRDEEDRERRGSKSVFLIDSLDALLYVVNLGCIPIHVLASRAGDLESGDFFTIDFDIGEGRFRDAVTLCLVLRELLEEAGLRGFVKTSGQTGLHVLVPVGPGVPFTVTKMLAELFGRLLEAKHPGIATGERRVEARGPRVFVDTGQTGRGRAIVAPYSVRAVAGATVSTPLEWDEVSAALDPRRFDILSVPARLEERADPMASMLGERPDVARAVEKLERRVRG